MSEVYISTYRGYLVAELNGEKVMETCGESYLDAIGFGQVINTNEEFEDAYELMDFLSDYASMLAA